MISRTATYYNARVGRTELDKLFLVASEGAPAGTVTVRCDVGSAHLREGTLDDLIAARAALPHVTNGTPWSQLTFVRDEGADKQIRIELNGEVVRVTVRSPSPSGRMGRPIGSARYWRRRTAPRSPAPTGGGSLQRLRRYPCWPRPGSFTRCFLKPRKTRLVVFTQALMAATGALILAMLIRDWSKLRSRRAVLDVTAEVQWGSAWSRLSSGDRIALVSVVIAGLTLVAAAAALF